MGSSCSSGQAHKDKDSCSTKSEESPAYQVVVKKASDAGRDSLVGLPQSHGNHSGLVLQPGNLQSTAAETQKQATPGPIRQLTASISDTGSIPSPPTTSPRDGIEPSLPDDVSHLSERFQSIITGRVTGQTLSSKTRKIVLYVCAADSQDCCVEKAVLHEVVAPELRIYCRDKGYELHVTDLHWRTGLEKQQDHEFPELCLGELNRQSEVGYIIPVLFLSNSLGTPLLPKTVESQDFEMALSQAEDKESLKKWYQLDSDSQPPCYRLLPVGSHIPAFKENSWEQREQALEEWRAEIERTLTAMINAFSEELRNTYLTTVVEQEVHNTILMSQELARRCLWLYRVYTQKPENNQTVSVTEQEQKRRLDILYKDLRSQLTEKHVVRLSVKWGVGGIDKTLPEHAQYIADVTSHLMKYLKATIFNIVEEDQSKGVIRPQYGIESMFLNELKWQTIFCQKAALSSVNREQIFQDVQRYLQGDSSSPLLIEGHCGSGKSTVLARIVQYIPTWLPDAYVIFRFSKISTLSFGLLGIVKTVCDHLALLIASHYSAPPHTLEHYGQQLGTLLSTISVQRPIIVILDGLDHVEVPHLDWLPTNLPNNAKFIVSAVSDSHFAKLFYEKYTNSVVLQIPNLNQSEAETLLLSSISQYSHSNSENSSGPLLQAVKSCTLPLYIKVLAWRSAWFPELKPEADLEAEVSIMFDSLDRMLGRTRLQITLSLLTVAKYGLWDQELLDILSYQSAFHSDTTYLKWAPACIFLSQLAKYLQPFLHWVSDGNNLTLRISDDTVQNIIRQRYVQQNHIYRNLIKSYFRGEWDKEEPVSKTGKKRSEKWSKKRKSIEVWHQSAELGENLDSQLLDHEWLFEMINNCNTFEVLDLINQVSKTSAKQESLEVVHSILSQRHFAFNYDGNQFYSQFYEGLKQKSSDEEWMKNCLSNANSWPPRVSLIALVLDEELPLQAGATCTSEHKFTAHRLPTNPDFVVSLSTERQEISVWNLRTCERVRTLTGISQPLAIQLIDDFRAVVLCGRELRIYDLDQGVLISKLKGLMHQKMAYFGLHDEQHVVALSRNRMYVNLMHLESGDCVATFKAGEDRFLNSLLVSGDGRILVCGDETQKPFPLLVWSLTSRKLLYDLRIPHHEFLTHLSAITHEGNYVCCVAKEVDEDGCNFIVVYDLQSGTLFKKWKPGVDTASLDISSKDSCVISGLCDARILVWDLVTGNCRWSLRGHSAPVTQVRRDPMGGRFLSADLANRDRSIRLWCLSKGVLLAVYTPPTLYSSCELSIGALAVILTLRNTSKIFTLKLCGPDIEEPSECTDYGDTTKKGCIFSMDDSR